MKMMKKLLSLPPNLVGCFHEIENVSHEEYFCTCDPIGSKLGSGGGTAWLLESCRREEAPGLSLEDWLAREKRILLHAGGQSRRLPSYAPSGKVLTPIPVFRWQRGQRISQNLLQLQMPLYEQIMEKAPASLRTLIVSGDVYVSASKLQAIPEADVVCYGLWVDPSLARNHGVFCSKRTKPGELDFMLQKPSVEKLGSLAATHLVMMDIGVWLLSDRAVRMLVSRSKDDNGEIRQYDLYGTFGCCLGTNPTIEDTELSSLSVAVLPLEGGEFYHYGTSREIISSTVALQNKVFDQRSIMQLGIKPHPSIFVQNSLCRLPLTSANENTWIENSFIPEGWTLEGDNIVTGVPSNSWSLHLRKGVCLDVVPISKFHPQGFAVRPYGMADAFRGDLSSPSTLFLGRSFVEWLDERSLSLSHLSVTSDLQAAPIFPVSHSIADLGLMLRWMLCEPSLEEGRQLWLSSPRLSANELSDYADLPRLQGQREAFRAECLPLLAANHARSVFYQTNLSHMAEEFHRHQLPLPEPLPETEPLLKRINDQMFRSQLLRLRGDEASEHEQNAFSLLRDGLTESVLACKQMPRLDVCSDQIVWGRSPVRIDLAGGWTDTPPYCLFNGGRVVNLAIDLNGQPPLHAYLKPCRDLHFTLRSIDLGAVEVVETYEQLRDYARVGSPFSIPKAALALAGFLPEFCQAKYADLQSQLRDFGCGIEVTLLSAIPAGSGLGTSSILSSTILGAISDFCGLRWDKAEVAGRTLVLEQMLTTGGGWQDQWGGVLPGIKMLSTQEGFFQTPEVRWLNTDLYTAPEYRECHLLYYTGITRTAKKILAEIVRGMFLNDTRRLELLGQMKAHAADVYDAFQRQDYHALGSLVRKTWQQNQLLDLGTNPPEVQAVTSLIDDLCLGYKLPGAGGGGYLYMMAKDPEAALRIRHILQENRRNDKARFVDMTLSVTGLQVSRS